MAQHRGEWTLEDIYDRCYVDENGCWLWSMAIANTGYGKVTHNGSSIGVHRLVLFLVNGEWPNTACHKCHTKACCNPEHLYDGTPADNMRDLVENRNTCKHCSRHLPKTVIVKQQSCAFKSKYTITAVNTLHDMGYSYREIAKIFDVNVTTVIEAIGNIDKYRHK